MGKSIFFQTKTISNELNSKQGFTGINLKTGQISYKGKQSQKIVIN